MCEGRKQLTISRVRNSLGKAASVPGSLGIGLEVGIKSSLAALDTAKNLQESKKPHQNRLCKWQWRISTSGEEKKIPEGLNCNFQDLFN